MKCTFFEFIHLQTQILYEHSLNLDPICKFKVTLFKKFLQNTDTSFFVVLQFSTLHFQVQVYFFTTIFNLSTLLLSKSVAFWLIFLFVRWRAASNFSFSHNVELRWKISLVRCSGGSRYIFHTFWFKKNFNFKY